VVVFTCASACGLFLQARREKLLRLSTSDYPLPAFHQADLPSRLTPHSHSTRHKVMFENTELGSRCRLSVITAGCWPRRIDTVMESSQAPTDFEEYAREEGGGDFHIGWRVTEGGYSANRWEESVGAARGGEACDKLGGSHLGNSDCHLQLPLLEHHGSLLLHHLLWHCASREMEILTAYAPQLQQIDRCVCVCACVRACVRACFQPIVASRWWKDQGASWSSPARHVETSTREWAERGI